MSLLSAEDLTIEAMAIVEDLQEHAALDVATILTLALALVSVSSTNVSRERTADIVRDALLEQMIRLDGRAARGETSPS